MQGSEEEEEEEEDDDGGEGMEVLLREGDHSPTVPTSPRPKKEISHIAATAESLQPKGYTLATTKVSRNPQNHHFKRTVHPKKTCCSKSVYIFDAMNKEKDI